MQCNATIAIIDNSIHQLAIARFNKFVVNWNFKFTYHAPSFYNTSSLTPHLPIDGVIVLGSNSYVADKLEWQLKLREFIVNKLEQKIPVLGICFGHQLIADAYGATIDFVSPDKKKYSGARLITFKQSWNNFKQTENLLLGYAHQQHITKLPSCFTTIASSTTSSHEIITHNTLPFIGVQCHPEVDEHFMQTYMEEMPTKAEQKKIIKNGQKILATFFHQFDR